MKHKNEMTLLNRQTSPIGSFAAIVIAVLGGVCAVDSKGQAFLGSDPIEVSPKVLADDAITVPREPQLVADSIELAETKAALEALQKQVERERDKAKAAEAKVRTLSESLAEANRVREEQTKAHNELQLKMQAFGVDLLNADPKSLESRLLKAVREIDQLRQSNQSLGGEVTSLSEVLFHYLQAVPEADSEARKMAETALKHANTALGLNAEPEIKVAKKISDAKVVSIDPEVGLLVVNVGRISGARIGMPLEVVQTNRPIGSAIVVDVRDSICGAVLQDVYMAGADVKVGDAIRLKPDEG